jgi:hypothetical protein
MRMAPGVPGFFCGALQQAVVVVWQSKKKSLTGFLKIDGFGLTPKSQDYAKSLARLRQALVKVN